MEVDNGININQLRELIDTKNTSKINHYDVFTLGRISVQKNSRLFNEIALKLPKLKFLWIGDGELRSELTAPNITVTGWLTRHEALKYSLNSAYLIVGRITDEFVGSNVYEKTMCS